MEKIKIKAREAEISIEEIETIQVEADFRKVEEVIEIHAEVVKADSREVEEVIEIHGEVVEADSKKGIEEILIGKIDTMEKLIVLVRSRG